MKLTVESAENKDDFTTTTADPNRFVRCFNCGKNFVVLNGYQKILNNTHTRRETHKEIRTHIKEKGKTHSTLT